MHTRKAYETPRKEVVDLNAAVLEVTALTRSEAVKTGVTVSMELAAGLRFGAVFPNGSVGGGSSHLRSAWCDLPFSRARACGKVR
jgi:hypothetical protein